MLDETVSNLKNGGMEIGRRILTTSYDMVHRYAQLQQYQPQLQQPGQDGGVINQGGGNLNEGATGDLGILVSLPNVQQVADVPMSKFKYNLIANIVIFLVIMIVYEICRRLYPSVYAGRKHHVSEERMAITFKSSDLPFSWILPVMRVSWSQVRKHGGLDAYLFLRYIRMCLVITCVSGFWCMVVLAPVYYNAGVDAEGWYHISLANVPNQSSLFWVTVVFMWLLSIYVFYVMDAEIQHYIQVKLEFLSRGDYDLHPYQRYSIMIENIPHELRSDTALYDYFNKLFPGKVHSAYVVLSIPELEAMSRRRQRVVRRLEKSIAIHEGTGKRPEHIGKYSLFSLFSFTKCLICMLQHVLSVGSKRCMW